MGYCVTPFAVGLSQVSQAIGSKNEPLLRALVDKFADDFEQYDEMAVDCHDNEDLDDPLTIQTALTQMIMGDPYNRQLGFMYGYALEFLCFHHGERLSNREWSAMPSGTEWVETVDRQLDRAGIPELTLRVDSHLIFRGRRSRSPKSTIFQRSAT